MAKFEPNYRLQAWLKKAGRIRHILRKIYFAEAHKLTDFSPFRIWRKFILQKNIRRDLDQYECLFLCQYPFLMRPLLLNAFHATGLKSKLPIIGIPDASHVSWHDAVGPYDGFVLNTRDEASDFQTKSSKAHVVVGSPHLSLHWQQTLHNFYQSLKPGTNQIAASPKGKKTALLLLVKPDHAHWEYRSFESVVDDLLKELHRQGYYVYLKPHPRHNEKDLFRLIEKYGPESCGVVYDYIGFWVSKVDQVVALPTFGCLAVLANERVPVMYWPMDGSYIGHLSEGGSSAFRKMFLRHTEGKYSLIFWRYVVENFNRDLVDLNQIDSAAIKLSNFKKDFRVHEPVSVIWEEIESLIKKSSST